MASLLFTIAIILFFVAYKSKKKGTSINLNDKFYLAYNEKGLKLVKDLENHFFGGTFPENLFEKSYYESFGFVFGENDKLTMSVLFPQMGLNNDNDMNVVKAQDHYTNIFGTLHSRCYSATKPLSLTNSKDASETEGINLFNDENLVERFNNVQWKEEKTKTVGVTYGGAKFVSGKGAFRTVFGSVKLHRHTETSFQTIDTGKLYLTDKRLIFVGNNNKNKTIRLERLVNTEVFEDGVFLGKENGTSPMIVFPDYKADNTKPWSDYVKRQVPNFMILLDKVMELN